MARSYFMALVLCGLSYSFAQHQTGVSSLENFGRIIILENGRKKPLDTYARSTLLRFSGRSSYGGEPAVNWLARAIFTPEQTQQDEIFMVNNMEVIHAMGLPLEPARRFSYRQLEKGLDKLRELVTQVSRIGMKNQSIVQKEMLRLFHNISAYINLASSFQFAVPVEAFTIHDSTLAQVLGLEPAPGLHSFYELFLKAGDLHAILSTVNEQDPKDADPFQKEVLRLTSTMFQWSRYYKDMPLHIIPATGHSRENWSSPWAVLNDPSLIHLLREEMLQLFALSRAFLKGEQATFDLAAQKFNSLVEQKIKSSFEVGRIRTELRYNKARPFFWAKLLCGLGITLLLGSLIGLKKVCYAGGAGAIGMALAPLSLGMLARMSIMGRPPVTTLYETFLFVGWMCLVLGLTAEWFQRKTTGLLTAGCSCLAMLMIAEKYALDGDTMGMLVAVLDSNFWLATHVTTVTMGYAGCCAAGVAGHVYILQRLFNTDRDRLRDTYKSIYGILAFGLVFAFIGTVLGGIWADQSWGRFWGWDPKENGALLVVLWSSILFHARLGGVIRELGMAAGSVIGIIMVMLAWFGVNLLGVGLHSYGFSSGAFIKLFSYIIIEFAFLALSIIWILNKGKE
ncbi:cytochrome c biogenesis protein [Fibrobacterota bacterium]